MSKSDFHTIKKLKLQVRDLVLSVLNVVVNTQVDTCKTLEETMHVHLRLFSQDSTFDLFYFFAKFFSEI